MSTLRTVLIALILSAVAAATPLASAHAADGTTTVAQNDADDARSKKKRRKKDSKKDKKTDAKKPVADEPAPDEPAADEAPAEEPTVDEAPAPEPEPREEPAAARRREAPTASVARSVQLGDEPVFDVRADFSVMARDALGRVAGGLSVGYNIHHAVALDARLAYGGGRDPSLEWLSAELAVRARPLRFLEDGNTGGSLVVQTGYALFFGTEIGDAAALPILAGFEYRTPSGAHFLALAGPTLVFMDASEYRDVFPEARAGFGWSF